MSEVHFTDRARKNAKVKAMEYINSFRNLGLSLAIAQKATVLMVEHMKVAADNNFVRDPDNLESDDLRYARTMAGYDLLITCIKSY